MLDFGHCLENGLDNWRSFCFFSSRVASRTNIVSDSAKNFRLRSESHLRHDVPSRSVRFMKENRFYFYVEWRFRDSLVKNPNLPSNYQ